MNIGEIISALCLCASDWDGDELLMIHGCFSIEVYNDNQIDIYFADSNKGDISINKEGKIL